jgi:serine/threonine protein kinase
MIVNNLNENRPVFTIQDKKYYLDNLIAEGGYALIYKIQSVEDNKFYALKKITIQSSSHKKQIKREIKIWKELSKFANIVELIDFQWGQKHAYIIMELCEEGTLLDYVNNYEGNIPELEALQIFSQILLGVNAMHSQNPPIAHRDLKIENILKKKRTYKLCDFGSASDEPFDPKISDEFVKEQNFSNFEKHSTLYYRAPEMCDRYGEHIVNEKVDIWSLGCIIFEMITGDCLFEPRQKNNTFSKDDDHLAQFIELLGKIPKNFALSGTESKRFFTKEGKLGRINTLHKRLLKDVLIKKYHLKKKEAENLNNFLLPMFEFSPEKRASAKQMLAHPWLSLKERENYIMSEWEIEKMNLIEETQKEKLSEDGGENDNNNNYIYSSEEESIQADDEDNDIYEENEELNEDNDENLGNNNLNVSMDSFADYEQ